MSVLIKEMKIPESCYMCDMIELSKAISCPRAYNPQNSEWGRALNCPLVEIPDYKDYKDWTEWTEWKFWSGTNNES